MEIGIVAQRGNDRAVALAGRIRDALAADGVEVRVDAATGDAIEAPAVPTRELAGCPLVVSVGGDGTFLYAARHVGSTPILGINLGEVGFLNAVPPGEAVERVRAELDRVRETGEPRYREVPRIAASGSDWTLSPGLNEVVIQGERRGRGFGVDVSVSVDGSEYVDTRADGVIVATPTGSTAYNLSEGGPLVHPDASGLIVTAMCPEAAARPLVIGPESAVTVEVSGTPEATIASDGSERRSVDAPATVDVGLADEPGRIAGPRSDFFQALSKIDR